MAADITTSSDLARPGSTANAPSALASSAQESWRSDIDGLRAIAVGAVVIYHFAASYLPGGFVGVDIFFVISGYLITGTIFREVQEGRFRITAFYERRIRRIFPALAVVLAAVLALTLAKEFPTTATASGEALLAAIASVTNIYFWATTDYFAQPAETLPLLHTWSLSVEEQFYLLLPAVMVVAGRLSSGSMRLAILALAAASLAWSIPAAFFVPSAAFYLLPSRAWELLLGSILAIGLVPKLQTQMQREFVAAIGLALIAASIVLLKPDLPFPGLAALPPCLGTAMIIHAGSSGRTWVARSLSLRPVVFIGLISYSLYLWHWPLIALHRAEPFFETDSKLLDRAALLLLSLILATLSWWFVERPCRARKLLPTRTLLIGSGVVATSLASVAIALIVTRGLPARYDPEVLSAARFLDNDQVAQFREGTCFLGISQPFSEFDQAACLPDRPGQPNYLVVGDSHAAHLVAGLEKVRPNANILQLSGVQCPPLIPLQPNLGRACPELLKLAFTELPRKREIQAVILSGHWNGGRLAKSNGWRADWYDDLKQTAAHFRSLDIPVIVIGPNPEYGLALPALQARAIEQGDPQLPSRSLVKDMFVIDEMLARFARDNEIPYVSLMKELCPDKACTEYAEPGVPLLFDGNHFNAAGSEYVARRLVRYLDNLPKSSD